MKLVPAVLSTALLLAAPAFAQTVVGTAVDRALAPPPATADDIQQKLKSCGDWWKRKLGDYEHGLSRQRQYQAYYEKWKNYPAQRPPKSQEPVLTRATYRLCMYECLGDATAKCPP
jgi:hypothetical protein